MEGSSSQLNELKLQVTELRAKLNLMLAKDSHADAERKRLQDEIALLRSSTSWRLTAPLRAIGGWIGKNFS